MNKKMDRFQSKKAGEAKLTKRRKLRCPICSTIFVPTEALPSFCSERCRKIDLGKWIDGDYVISRPIEQADLDEGE